MKVLESVTFTSVLRHFAEEHPFDESDEANSNDEALTHLHDADLVLGGRWHLVELERIELLSVVLPWHLGENGGQELIPKAGLTLAAAAARLVELGPSYAGTNPLCARKLDRQTAGPPTPVFLSTCAVPGADYEGLAVREGLIHLDGLHRMLAWERHGRLASMRGAKAYLAGLDASGLPAADVWHGAGHDQDGLDVHPHRQGGNRTHHVDDVPHVHGGLHPQ